MWQINTHKVLEIASVLRYLNTNPQIQGSKLDTILKDVLGNSPYPYTSAFYMFCTPDIHERISQLDSESFMSKRFSRIAKRIQANDLEYLDSSWEKLMKIHNFLAEQDLFVYPLNLA